MKYLVLVLAILLFPTNPTYAQTLNSFNGSIDTEPSIELEPLYPDPNSLVTASINDFSQSTQANGIVWYIDDERVVEADNQRSIEIRTKDANQTTNISAVLEMAGGKKITVRRSVKPIYLDIVVEPQTRVPSFYQGRALPSIGSEVNLTAIVNGGDISPENLTYHWAINNKVLAEGSLRGKDKVSTTIGYGGDAIISLSVSKTSGGVLARRSVSIPSVEPKVLFYEIDPLYGTKQIPIKNSFNLIGNNESIQAEPYFLDILTYNRPSLLEWKVDGVRSPNNGSNPYKIVLARQNGRGSTKLDFHVRNLEGFLQGTQGSVNINY